MRLRNEKFVFLSLASYVGVCVCPSDRDFVYHGYEPLDNVPRFLYDCHGSACNSEQVPQGHGQKAHQSGQPHLQLGDGTLSKDLTGYSSQFACDTCSIVRKLVSMDRLQQTRQYSA